MNLIRRIEETGAEVRDDVTTEQAQVALAEKFGDQVNVLQVHTYIDVEKQVLSYGLMLRPDENELGAASILCATAARCVQSAAELLPESEATAALVAAFEAHVGAFAAEVKAAVAGEA